MELDSMIDILKRLAPYKFIKLLDILRSGNAMYIFNVFSVKRNKIVISSFNGKGYGDNGKYIVEEIIRQQLKCEIVWLVKENKKKQGSFPNSVRIEKYGSLKALFEMATAKIWIGNSRKTFFPPKKKKQYYIQTWHSPIRLKKIENDAIEYLSENYIRKAKLDSKNCDLMISGCDFSYNIYRNSFWYDGEILKCGTPRCDIFFKNNSKIKSKVYKFLGINSNMKVVLFAPTFRTGSSIEEYSLDFYNILQSIENRFGGAWKLIIRLHPNVSHLSSNLKYDDRVIDVTNYDDMQELLYVAEILITDYSSSMFDMAIANKICFVHAKDVQKYLSKERELYFRFEDLPFSFSSTDCQLINNILKYNEMEYKEKINQFLNRINNYETGIASRLIVDKISEQIEIE